MYRKMEKCIKKVAEVEEEYRKVKKQRNKYRKGKIITKDEDMGERGMEIKKNDNDGDQ